MELNQQTYFNRPTVYVFDLEVVENFKTWKTFTFLLEK